MAWRWGGLIPPVLNDTFFDNQTMKTLHTLLTVALLCAMLAPLILAAAKVGGQMKPGRSALTAMRRAFGLRGGVVVYNTEAADKPRLIFAPAVAIALNADALPEWIQLAPYGEHLTRDKKRTQVFNAESAAQVVSWFDFWPRKIGRLMGINACPVWVGHPDFDPQTWPQRRQVGAVKELNAREDGLWGKIEWNADAEKALREDGHKFPSVAWDCDESEVNAEQITPVMLWSVGMWHKPNIKSVQSVINAEMEGDDYEDEDEDEDEDKGKDKPGGLIENIKALLKKDGIMKDTDSDNDVLSAIGSLLSSLAYSRQDKVRREEEVARLRTALNATDDAAEQVIIEAVITELNAARSSLTDAMTQITEINAARVQEAVERLIETGRITKAESEAVTTELNADFSAALSKRLAAPVQLSSKPIQLNAAKPAVMEAHERRQKLLEWVERRMSETNCSYDEAWSASKADNEMKLIHEAMQTQD